MRPAMYNRLIMMLALLLAGCAPLGSAAVPTMTLAPSPTTATIVPTISAAPTSAPSAAPTSAPDPPPPTDPPPPPTPTLASLDAGERSRVFEQVWTLIRDRYVYTDFRGQNWDLIKAEFAPKTAAASDPTEFYDLIDEMIGLLGDDHTRLDSPQDVAEEQASFDGTLTYAGIGAMIRDVPEGILITRLARGGPADIAGLKPRDLVVAIDGVLVSDTVTLGPAGPIGKVRGPSGTAVTLTVISDGAERQVPVTRRVIAADAFPDVEALRLPNSKIGYLLIDTFSVDDLDGRVRDALENLAEAGPLDGLIIDVRDNSGGRIDYMLNTIALFQDGGTIGKSSGRDYSDTLTVPGGRVIPAYRSLPIAILTGDGSVSAAEMFSAGMQHLGRAKVVGTRSAGNTENLLSHDLEDGSRLWLAELVFRLPDGTLIEGKGVIPDREVAADYWRFPLERDPQVKAAVDVLAPT